MESSVPETEAQVQSESIPIRWTIHLRQYGTSERHQYHYNDSINNLSPPVTSNATYTYTLPLEVSPMAAYELCLQSHNAGQFHSSPEVHFPEARTRLTGSGNPLYLCREIIPALATARSERIREDDSRELLDDELDSGKRGKEHVGGRSNSGNVSRASSSLASPGDSTTIVVDKEAADAFVVYTAISSASTSSLILVVILLFCCFRCRKPKKHRKFPSHHPADNNHAYQHCRYRDNFPHILNWICLSLHHLFHSSVFFSIP